MSLAEHLSAGEQHARLPFSSECPICWAQRLGERPAASDALPRRFVMGALAVYLTAAVSGVPLASGGPAPAHAQTPFVVPAPDDSNAPLPGAEGEPVDPNAPESPESEDPAEPPTGPSAPEPPPEPEAVENPDGETPPPLAPTPPLTSEVPGTQVPPEAPAPPAIGTPPAPAPVAPAAPLAPAAPAPPAPPAQDPAPAVAEVAPSAATATASETATATETATDSDNRTDAQTGSIHVVRAGESLWSIARELLPARATSAQVAAEVARLWNLNQDRIGSGDPNLILPGERLRIS